MFSEHNKTQLFMAWAIVVCLVALAVGIDSATKWVAVACLAVVPPLVTRRFWHAPDRTMSESIRDARG